MEIYFIKELISMVFNFIKTNFFFSSKGNISKHDSL